jgi:hypothetical protein
MCICDGCGGKKKEGSGRKDGAEEVLVLVCVCVVVMVVVVVEASAGRMTCKSWSNPLDWRPSCRTHWWHCRRAIFVASCVVGCVVVCECECVYIIIVCVCEYPLLLHHDLIMMHDDVWVAVCGWVLGLRLTQP